MVYNLVNQQLVRLEGKTGTLLSENWDNNTQTITVDGVSSSNIVIVTPGVGDGNKYSQAGIECIEQSINSLTFHCDNIPNENINVNIVVI